MAPVATWPRVLCSPCYTVLLYSGQCCCLSTPDGRVESGEAGNYHFPQCPRRDRHPDRFIHRLSVDSFIPLTSARHIFFHLRICPYFQFHRIRQVWNPGRLSIPTIFWPRNLSLCCKEEVQSAKEMEAWLVVKLLPVSHELSASWLVKVLS